MNIDALRARLIDYYGTAMVGDFSMAMMEMSATEYLSDYEVVKRAKALGWIDDINDENDR